MCDTVAVLTTGAFHGETMTLHYHRPNFVMIGLYFLAGLVLAYFALTGYELRILFIPLGPIPLLIVAVLSVLFGCWSLRQAFRPDPVHIDEAGLRLRVAGINRVVPWGAIDAVHLEPYANPGDDSRTHRLVVVPAPGVDLGRVADHRNQADGRQSIVLLELDETMHTFPEVAQVLAMYAGPRYVPVALSPDKGPAS